MHELFDEEFYDKMDDEKPVFDEEEDEFIVSISLKLKYNASHNTLKFKYSMPYYDNYIFTFC